MDRASERLPVCDDASPTAGAGSDHDRHEIPRDAIAAIETREMAGWLALLTRLKLQIGVGRNRAFLREQETAEVIYLKSLLRLGLEVFPHSLGAAGVTHNVLRRSIAENTIWRLEPGVGAVCVAEYEAQGGVYAHLI